MPAVWVIRVLFGCEWMHTIPEALSLFRSLSLSQSSTLGGHLDKNTPSFPLNTRHLSPVRLGAIKYSSERKHGGVSEPQRDDKMAMQLDLEEPSVRVSSQNRKATRMRVTIFTWRADDFPSIEECRFHWSMWRKRFTFLPLTGFTGIYEHLWPAMMQHDRQSSISFNIFASFTFSTTFFSWKS